MEEKKFFNFNGNEDFDLNKEYSSIFGDSDYVPLNKNQEKLKDADNVITELGTKYIEYLSLKEYEDSYVNLEMFLSKFRTDSEEVKAMTKDDRDKLFGYGKELFNYYQNRYSALKFNFELTIKEWQYIENTLTKKISYNGQEMFNYWELYSKFIEPTKEEFKKLQKKDEIFTPICTIQSLVLMSHLLMKHEEKGSTEQFHNFRVVLTEIAKMTKLFNAYGVILERSTNKFNNWVNALNAIDGFNNEDRTNETEQ